MRQVGIAAVVAAALIVINVYMALRVGVTDSGHMLAATAAWALAQAARAPMSPQVHVYVVTFATGAATCTTTAGLTTMVPAMEALGQPLPAWVVIVWGAASASLGVALAARFGRALIVREDLPFPTSRAVSETIVSLRSGRRRAAPLVAGAAGAALFAAARDLLHWLPAMIAWPARIRGVALDGSGCGLALSPAIVAVGALIGAAGSLAIAIAAAVVWLVLVPELVIRGVAGPSYPEAITWLVWPALGLMMADPLGHIARGLRDVAMTVSVGGGGDRGRARWMTSVATLGGIAGLIIVGHTVLHVPWPVGVITVALAAVAAAAISHGAAATDVIAAESAGQLTQVTLGAAQLAPGASMATGVLVMGASSQAALAAINLRAVRALDAAPRSALFAQLAGAIVGVVFGYAVYLLLARDGGVGSEALPAPQMATWKAVALAAGGDAGLPPGAAIAAALALCGGLALAALRRHWRWLPSPALLGIGFLLPASVSAAIGIGGGIAWIVGTRAGPRATVLVAVAAGVILGESVMGVVGVL